MLDVLLVKIQPTDLLHGQLPKGYNHFSNNESLDFEVSVLNGETLQFKSSKRCYFHPKNFSGHRSIIHEKVEELDKELGVIYGGDVVAIDKYPYSQFEDGVKIYDEQKDSNRHYHFSRYEIECCSENFDYNSIILLIPGREPILLSTLKIACSDERGFCPSFIVFKKEAVLSLRSPFGEVIGIALEHCNKEALKPDHTELCYTMSFEKVSLPAVVLQKLLETKPQSESEPNETAHE